MTADHLRQLESRLWTAADDLRANSRLTATEYSFPVLGLIFLRHAYNRYEHAKKEIEKDLPVHPQRGRRAITKDDFLAAKAIFLDDHAQWDNITNLPEGEDIGEYVNEAMRSIEEHYDVLEGVLPKDYNLFEPDLLHRLLRVFNDDALQDVDGDVFGRIYEYFLNKFAMTGASEGGEFFTPPSLVDTIVRVIEPTHGIILDPAVGSAGMFVQTAHFIEEKGFDSAKKVTFYGQEKADQNTKLAKMNMTVHGLDGDILQGNTFYDDQHDLVGQCDFVMANPPFNVDGVDKKKASVKTDPRLPFGLPRNDNANYLWIQYFYAYLNETGRAGFVMASSASDAGHSEKLIRQQLVETGAVDVMVSIGTKFFYTRSLPCSLWFFDRGKTQDAERKEQTFMLDLREVYRKVSSSLHDFTPEQLDHIQAIVALYRWDDTKYHECITHYDHEIDRFIASANDSYAELHDAKVPLPPYVELAPDNLNNQSKVLSKALKSFENQLKADLKSKAAKEDKDLKSSIKDTLKELAPLSSQLLADFDQAIYFHKCKEWLSSRFPDGKYQDVPGLCKVVSRSDIEGQDYSLTPGRYVGVAPQIDEDFDYEERMGEIKIELQGLNDEAVQLAQTIQDHLNELGL